MKKKGLNRVKRVGLIMLVMMITVTTGAFASSVWSDASDIAENSLS